MTEVLLEELSDSDINWMVANGRQQELAPGSVLIQQQRDVDALYIVLDGMLAATITRNQGVMGRVFAALEDDQDLEQEIARFSSGEVLGELSFLSVNAAATTVKAADRSVVLAVPRERLLDKIQEDVGFASRFYRAIAILLLGRFERLVKLYLRHKSGQQIQPLQDIPVIFGELNDSDVDWMVQHSHLEGIAAGTVLIRAARPVENLYVLIEGTLSVSVSEIRRNALSRAFALLESSASSAPTEESIGREISRASRGEIIGETALLDSRLSNSTVTALDNSLLLVVPRQQLLIKLQQNPAMSARFYRVIAMLLGGRLQGLISRLGYGRDSYRIGQTLSSDVQYEDEIDLEVMDNITLGGARFDWMLRRLKVRGA